MSAEQRRVLVASIVCFVMAPLAVIALEAAPQVDLPDSDAPSAIERALIERTCRATELSTEIDAHRQCLNAQMLWLRTDFGRDLGRLAGPDRRRIDAACSRLSAAGQREAYLDCLGGQLITLHNRRNRGNPAVTQEVAVAGATSPLLAPTAAPPPAATASSWASTIAIAGTLGTALAAAGSAQERGCRGVPQRCVAVIHAGHDIVRDMFRAARIAIAAVLALAVAALPIVLDRCAESCEAHRDTIASTPACHHVASTGTHISQVPAACGHDHNGTAATAAKSSPPTGRTFDSIVTVDSQRAAAPPAPAHLNVHPHSPPGSSSTFGRRSLPLRV
jgi:hypothetical protein